MDSDLNVFVGMVKETNIFVLGQVVEGDTHFALKYIARVFEVQTGEGRIAYQFHPDPYFTSEATSFLDKSDFLMWRIESNQDDKMIREYKNFLNQVRMQKMGLVTGSGAPKNILKEIK